jgi:hypothetical protein
LEEDAMMRLFAFLGLTLPCIMFGCIPNRLSLVFKGNILQSSCAFSTGGSDFVTQGTIDLFYTSKYHFAAEVKNMLSGTDSSSVIISSVRWKLTIAKPLSTFLACGQMLAKVSDGHAPCPSTTTNAIYQKYFEAGIAEQFAVMVASSSSLALQFNFLNSEVMDYLYNTLKTGATGEAPYFASTDSFVTILAEIEISGKSLGEVEVSTGPFVYPITVCYGCLRAQPNGASCSSGTSDTGASLLTKPCYIGQDDLIDCRYACGRDGDCKTNETCSKGACYCGSNAGCTNNNSCSGSACNCGGATACTGSQTCTSTVGVYSCSSG